MPEDPLAPIGHAFAEPWHAQVLASAQALIRAGHVTSTQWAETLGAALKLAETSGKPDTEDTYYQAALSALETVAPFSDTELASRKSDWEDAYRRTPHGKPVEL
ncbi:nitrile hydratase accessory protein [Rhodobacteraceae bacterium]|nr:nitrile hydratase accessory protein [Paracoccaceae bacterium]